MKIEFVREKLSTFIAESAAVADEAHAAVAIVFREGSESLEVLLIERAEREGDPWSGHMAFPGGRLEPQDDSSLTAAQRETLEEVGVELSTAEYLGPVEAMNGQPRRHPNLVVAAHAFFLTDDQPFRLQPSEVQDAFWFPLSKMLEESRSVEFTVPQRPGQRFPGVLVGQPERHVVWGLTYRFLENLLSVLGHSFPAGGDRS